MTTPSSFEGLWADAVAVYEKQTDRKIDRDNTFREFKSLDDLEKAINSEQERFSAFRNHHGKVFANLAKCIGPMQPILVIVQKGIGNTPFAPASAVFGAATYLIQACSTVSKSYDSVEALFEQIGDITIRLKEYEYGGIDTPLKLKMTDILAYILEIMGKAEAAIKRKRIKQWVRSAFLVEDDINSSVTKLQKYVETELGLVIALTYGRVKDVQAVAEDTRSQVSVVKSNVKELLTNQRSDRQRAFSEADEKKLSDALATASTDEIAQEHVKNVESLTKGTGLWIRDDVMFKAWEQEEAPILWVFGKPGVGKTMLAARTIETLQNRYPQHSDIPSLTSVSYLYFKDDKPNLQDCAQMWKAVALQIAKANDRFKKHVITAIDKKQDTFASARRIWQQLFLDFFTEEESSRSLASLAFIIVDGLDEAPEPERVKFLSCLAELVGRTTNDRKCRIQVAVFARPDVRADPGFEKVGYRRQERIIEVTPDRNSVDIEAFIRQRLNDVAVLKMLKKRKATKEYQSLAKQIYSSVQSRSQGMFLWASLVFDQLWDLPSPEAIKEALRDAPEGLDDMLHHVFKRLDVEEHMHRSYLSELLSWVFCTYRPLYVSELFVLLLMTAGQHCYMIEDHLKGRYSSLFDLMGQIKEDDEEDEETDDGSAGPTPDDDNESDVDDFDFLDNPDSDENASDNEDEATDSGNDEDQSTTQVDASTSVADPKDDEDTFEIPSRWYRTTVTFSHARIRDYLAMEGDPATRRWQDCSIVPDNLNMTRLLISLACIQILRTDVADRYGVESLKTYAKINWIKHLVEVDFSKISRQGAAQAAQHLATLFHNGQAMLETSFGEQNEFMATWFSTAKYSSLVRKTITDNINEIHENDREWAASLKTSARALFQPLISACARTWLTKTGWDDMAYLDKSEREVWLMYAFSTLTEDGSNDGDVDSFNSNNGMWNIPLESVLMIAELEPIPKTEHYYAGIAWILMEAEEDDYTEKSIEYFKKALEMKPGGWMALEGLARCYGDNLRQFGTAINYMEDAIHCLPDTDNFAGIDFYLQTRIADWKIQNGNAEDSVGIAKEAYEGGRNYYYGTGTAGDASILRSVKHYIEALYQTEAYDQVIQVVHELDRTATLERKRSLWTIFLRAQHSQYYSVSLFDKLGHISRALKDQSLLEFMKHSIEIAVDLKPETVSEDRSIWLAAEGAEWLYHYGKEPEESIHLWDTMVTLIDQSNEVIQQNYAWYRTRAASFLSMMYFTEAVTAYNDGKESSQYIDNLENLAKHKQGSKRYYRASYPAGILGLWLHEYGRADEETWRACLRPSIKQGLYMLSDEDPWNDQSAYAQLGQALLQAGDEVNALIALGITTKPLEEVRLSKSNDAVEIVETVETTESTTSPDGEIVSIEDGSGNDEATHDVPGTLSDEEYVPVSAADTHTTDDVPTSPEIVDGEAHTGTANDETEQHDGDADSDVTKADEAAEETMGKEDDDVEVDEGNGVEDETASLNPKYAGFDCMWTCDGPCNAGSTEYEELYFCRFCNDVCFCEKCIELVRDDKMPFRRCASDHPHVRAFPMTEEAKVMTDALIERRFEVQQEWIQQLRKVWEA